MRHIIYITKSVPKMFLTALAGKNSKYHITNTKKCAKMAEKSNKKSYHIFIDKKRLHLQ